MTAGRSRSRAEHFGGSVRSHPDLVVTFRDNLAVTGAAYDRAGGRIPMAC